MSEPILFASILARLDNIEATLDRLENKSEEEIVAARREVQRLAAYAPVAAANARVSAARQALLAVATFTDRLPALEELAAAQREASLALATYRAGRK